MPVPAQCQALSDDLERLESERLDLQVELNHGPRDKVALGRQINHLVVQITAKKAALDACVAQNSGPNPVQPSPSYPVLLPDPRPLLHPHPAKPQAVVSTLTGQGALVTDKHFPGEPFLQALAWAIEFDALRTQVVMRAATFKPWVLNTTAIAKAAVGAWPGFGTNNTTISLRADALGTYANVTASGRTFAEWTLPLKLHFAQDYTIPFVDVESNLAITLTVQQLARHIPPSEIMLTGRGVISGGWLAGAMCTIEVDGTIAPVP